MVFVLRQVWRLSSFNRIQTHFEQQNIHNLIKRTALYLVVTEAQINQCGPTSQKHTAHRSQNFKEPEVSHATIIWATNKIAKCERASARAKPKEKKNGEKSSQFSSELSNKRRNEWERASWMTSNAISHSSTASTAQSHALIYHIIFSLLVSILLMSTSWLEKPFLFYLRLLFFFSLLLLFYAVVVDVLVFGLCFFFLFAGTHLFELKFNNNIISFLIFRLHNTRI